jgi:plasmid stabilization system protein ParE
MKIRVLKSARDDLREIQEQLAELGENPPVKFRSSFEKFSSQVSDMPYMYSKYEYNHVYRRAVIAYDYLVFYRVDESAGEVKIYRVLHGKRNIVPLSD